MTLQGLAAWLLAIAVLASGCITVQPHNGSTVPPPPDTDPTTTPTDPVLDPEPEAEDESLQRFEYANRFDWQSCSHAEGWITKKDVDDIGKHGKINATRELRAVNETRGGTYEATWNTDGDLIEVWVIFTKSNGNVLSHKKMDSYGLKDPTKVTLNGFIPKDTVWVVLFACKHEGDVLLEYVSPAPE